MPFTIKALMAMGLTIGADVPFFVYGKPSVATGIGEKLEPVIELCPFPVLLVCPRISVSTRAVYKKLNLGLTKCEIKINNFVSGGRNFEVPYHLCNDLETVSALEYPVIQKAKQSLLSAGARGALMSGSGPAVFGLFSNMAAARSAHRSLASNGDWDVYFTGLSV
jgi:4-diphosphocytidyl-2-C-methyl-D-erythritol kinase